MSWAVLFFGHRPKRYRNDRKKLSHFDQEVRKQIKQAMASFDTTVRQMTEMFQWAKYLSKKWPKCLIERKKTVGQFDTSGTVDWERVTEARRIGSTTGRVMPKPVVATWPVSCWALKDRCK